MNLKNYLIEYMTENRTEPMAFFFSDKKTVEYIKPNEKLYVAVV